MPTSPLPLRVWVPASLGMLAVVLTVLAFVHDSFRTRHTVQNQMRLRALSLGSRVSGTLESLIGRGENEMAAAEVARLTAVPNLTRALVLDEADRVLYATDLALRKRLLRDTPAAGTAALMARARAERSAQMELTSDGDSLHAAFPFSLAPPPGEASSSRIVVLYTETDLVATLRAEQAGMAQRSLLMGMMTLLICVAIWVGFWMPFARRLNSWSTALASRPAPSTSRGCPPKAGTSWPGLARPSAG